MQLPNAIRAVVDLEKLRDYCLNPDHPRGRHRARVFARRLGLRRADASTLRAAILAAAILEPARAGHRDAHGARYTLDFEMSGVAGSGTIRTHWVVRDEETFPRLTSCHVR